MSEKIDKGFELIYWKLTYRRKLIRTLWMVPFVFLMLLLPADFVELGLPRNVHIVLALVLFGVQAAYNYCKWRNTECIPVAENQTEHLH